MHRRILLAFFAVIGIAQIALADSPSVTAVLSNSEVTVGETVELQIKVAGPAMRGRQKKFQSMAWRFIPPERHDNSKYTTFRPTRA